MTLKSALEYLKDFDSYTPYQEAINKVSDWIELFQANYEARLKADMVAMLTDLKNELIDISWNIDMYDSDLDFECCYLSDIDKVIQQKIDKLKGERGNENSD